MGLRPGPPPPLGRLLQRFPDPIADGGGEYPLPKDPTVSSLRDSILGPISVDAHNVVDADRRLYLSGNSAFKIRTFWQF